MTKNTGAAETETDEPIFSCDGCETQGPHKATDDGRALMCDPCRTEYNAQMAE